MERVLEDIGTETGGHRGGGGACLIFPASSYAPDIDISISIFSYRYSFISRASYKHIGAIFCDICNEKLFSFFFV